MSSKMSSKNQVYLDNLQIYLAFFLTLHVVPRRLFGRISRKFSMSQPIVIREQMTITCLQRVKYTLCLSLRPKAAFLASSTVSQTRALPHANRSAFFMLGGS